MERRRVKIRPIRPHERTNFGIDPDLNKDPKVAQRPEEFSSQDRFEIDRLFQVVIELYAQSVRRYDLNGSDAADAVNHGSSSFQRFDRRGRLPRLQLLPVRQQLSLMQFRPGFDKASLSPGERPGDQVDRFETEHRHVVLVVRVECGRWCGTPTSMYMRMMMP